MTRRSISATASVKSIVARVTPVSLAVQACSFLSSVALATYLGASYQTDAYYLALSIPLLVYGIVIGGIRVGAIPALNDENARRDEGAFASACSELMTAVLLAAVVVAGVAIIASILTLPLLSSSSDPRTFSLARTLVLELSPLTITGAMTGALGAILTVRGRYVAPIAVMGLEPIAKIVLVVAFATSLGAHALVLGNVVGSGVAMVILAGLLYHDGIGIRWRLPRNSPFLRTVLTVSAPLLIGQIVLQINPVTDRLMASALAPGSITVLELGYRMFGVSTVVLVGTLIAPVTATWAARFQASGWPALQESAFRAMRLGLFVLPPIVGISIVLREQIVTFLYHGGEYGEQQVHQTAEVFGYYMLALPAQVLTGVVAAIFIVRKNTITPMWIASANVVLNIGLDYVLRAWLGVGGIALSTTITYTLLWIVFLAAVGRRYGGLHLHRLIRPLLRVAVMTTAATLAAGALGYVLGVPSSRAGALGVLVAGAAAGVGTYTLLLLSFGDRQVFRAVRARLARSGSAKPEGTPVPIGPEDSDSSR